MGGVLSAIAAGPQPIKIDPTLAIQRRIQLGDLQAQQAERMAQADAVRMQSQLRQQAFADQNALRNVYMEDGGWNSATSPAKAAQYGASPESIDKAQAAHDKHVTDVMANSKTKNELVISHSEQASRALDGISQLPPEQRGPAIAQFWKNAAEWMPADELNSAQQTFGAMDDRSIQAFKATMDYNGKLASEANARNQTQSTIAKNDADIAKTKVETAGLEAKNAAQQKEKAAQELGLVSDQASYDKWAQANPQVAGVLGPNYDPKSVDMFRRSVVPIEKQPEFDIATQKARMGLVGNSEYDQFLIQYARSLNKTPAQLSPEEGMESFQKFAEFKQDPQMRAAALAQKNVMQLLHSMTLSQMPTKEDAAMLADDIRNHRLAPDQLSQIRGRGNGQLGLMVEREMKKTDPTFNWEEASAEFQLSKSPGFQQTVRYMDYVGSSVDNVIRAADTLANGKVRSINGLMNAGKAQFNNVNLAKFNTDRLEVADAIAKILQGGGTGSGTSDMKLKQAQDLIRATDDPAVVRATMGEIKGLIANRRSTLTRGTFMENAAPEPATSATGQRKPLNEIFK